MRFIADGPNIPDQLLEKRDAGRVVFLCGAGVSSASDMPSFEGLTRHVIGALDPPDDSEIMRAFQSWDETNGGPKTPLDQVFHLLHQEYGRDEVNALVAERLSDSDMTDAGGREHDIISRVSSDQEGNPQIVTTNFDLLFERAGAIPDNQIYVPPAFPDISYGIPITGITYLHGRLESQDAKHHPYVLSSADFGRAYLSEGWATSFIRSLLKQFTVVLVGYQAEDPPVKYLLQGLNHDGLSDRSNLYVFDRGAPEEIEAKWRDRGVTAIAYSGEGHDHSSLWNTLEAWAERADDPRVWRARTVNLAKSSPRELEAHERGQVAHLVRTTSGARLFSNSDPSPSSEWLCVFDAGCRAANPSKSYGEDATEFDPLEVYGLDDDLPRPQETGRRTHRVHDDLLVWRRGDTNPTDQHRLGGRQTEGFEPMPSRLTHLTNWAAKHLDSPLAAWWAFRQNGLHHRLADQIRSNLRRNNELHPTARQIWNAVLEYQNDRRNYTWNEGWYELKDRIDIEGWTPSVLRDFEYVTAPKLARNRPLGLGASKPPLGTWEETPVNEIVGLAIKFPKPRGEEIEIPDENLNSAVMIAQQHLIRAAGMLVDLNTDYFRTPTCYPDRDVDGKDSHSETDSFFLWFVYLLGRFISIHPTEARANVLTWPNGDRIFFGKLKLFALNHATIFDGSDVVDALLELDQNIFWDFDVRRELLFLISDRWKEFDSGQKSAVMDRILSGPDKMEHWSIEEYPNIRNGSAARYSKWLVEQGCDIASEQATRLDVMISGLEDWHDSWTSGLVTQNGINTYSIGVDETPEVLVDLPVDEVVERANAELERDFRSHTDKRPFTGLVKLNPRKALLALSNSARQGNYPTELWSALINDWPEETPPRVMWAFLKHLGELPSQTVVELRHPIGNWLRQKFSSIYNNYPELAWDTFDNLVSGLVSNDGAATVSGRGTTMVGGEVVESSRRTYGHAINGPIGMATEGLLNALNSLKLGENIGLPDEFTTRIERLLAAPREGSDHAISILTINVDWLCGIDPTWVGARIVPWFTLDHPAAEPAWNGFLSSGRIPYPAMRLLTKEVFLNLYPRIYEWHWDRELSRVASDWVVWMAIFRPTEPDGLTRQEARRCLRNMSDRNRNDAIYLLSRIGKENTDGWTQHVIPFVNQVWPRERVYRTSESVSAWVSLLDDTGEDFPTVLQAVRKFLVSVERESHWLYRFYREVGGDEPLTASYPESVLEMLDAVVPNVPEDVPAELAQILELIEETEPRLTRDRRFYRLIDLVEQR